MESFALHSLSSRSFTLLHRFPRPTISKSQHLIPSRSPILTLRSSSSSSSSSPNPYFHIQASSAVSQRRKSSPFMAPVPTHGAKPILLILSLPIGVVVKFFVPKPVEVTPKAWQLIVIFQIEKQTRKRTKQEERNRKVRQTGPVKEIDEPCT
ncbi:hypothetical protein PanWU01x14_276210 [Parasponia andersonii]|uniref:Uncharacterized protein n=1 Tax=Parasponia andersonii TaxID=3476 RepID=A0A2P5B2W5_PARAD|nr:hypothetical protein PanWU01x14_276210 [Parasponia andersonii]